MKKLFILFMAAALMTGFGIYHARAGTLEFDGVPVDITTTANEDLVIVPGAGGNTQIGDAEGTNTNATSNDDLHITGVLETDGAGYFDSSLFSAGTLTMGSNIVSDTDSTDDLGTSSIAWANLYVDSIKSITGTDLSLSPASGSGLTGSVTRSAATGNEVAYDLSAVINKATSGNYTGLKLNVTQTLAPGTADRLIDLQVGGTSLLQVYNAADSANYGLLSLGSDDWDGSTAGFFSGSSNGTQLAINAASGFTGNLADFQVAGTSIFSVDSSGNVTAAGTISGSSGAGANTALSNLASVAVNTSLVSDTDSTDDLGSSSIAWANLYTDAIRTASGQNLTINTDGGTIDIDDGTLDLSTQTVDVTLNNAADALNFDSNTLSIDAANNKIGIGTNAPDGPLHIYNSSAASFKVQTDADALASFNLTNTNASWDFRVLQTTGNFTVRDVNNTKNIISVVPSTIGAKLVLDTTETILNDGGNDVDFRIEGSSTSNLFVVDAGTEQIQIPDDKPIALGSSQDALIDYDSGNNSLDIDLATNGVNAGLNVATDGDANTLNIDGQYGSLGVGQAAGSASQIGITTTKRFGLNVSQTSTSNYPSVFKASQTTTGGSQATAFNFTLYSTGTTPPTDWLSGAAFLVAQQRTVADTFDTSGFESYALNGINSASSYSKGNLIGFRASAGMDTSAGGAGTQTYPNAIAFEASPSKISGSGIMSSTNYIGILSKATNPNYWSGGTWNVTNAYGSYFEEQTIGSNNYEMFLAGGGEVFFRDQAIHLGSLDDGHLDLTADTSIDLNGDVTVTGTLTASGGIGTFSLNDDTALTFGTDSDVNVDYDSGTTALNIDLTGVANTDLDVTTSGGANTFFIDGENATVGINTNTPRDGFEMRGAKYLTFSGANVAHGVTDYADTDIYGSSGIANPNSGGFIFSGLSEGTFAGVEFAGVLGLADPADTIPAVQFRGYKKSGTAVANLGDDETLAAFDNGNANPVLRFMGDGDIRFVNDDIGIELGASQDVRIDYDSGTTALNIDLTGVANTDLDVTTSGGANTFFIDGQNARVGIGTNAPSVTLDVRGGATFNSDLADEDFIVYSKFNQFFTIDSGLNRVGIGTDAPLTRLHVNGTNPAVFMSDAGNGGYWSFGSRTGNFRITENDASNVIVNQYLQIGVGGGDAAWNYNNEDLDVVFNGDTAEIARFNAGTDTLDFPDDKAIKFGSGGDALIDYDSGNNSLDIDLKTNGVDTGLRIITDGENPAIGILGASGHIGFGTVGLARYHVNMYNANPITTNGFSGGLDVETQFQPAGTASSYHDAIGGYAYILDPGTSWGSAQVTGLHFGTATSGTVNNAGSLNLVGTDVTGWFDFGPSVSVASVTGAQFTSVSSDWGAAGTLSVSGNAKALNIRNSVDANMAVTGDNIGINIEEQSETTAANNYEVFLEGAGEIFFRDNALHLGSLTDGHLDLTADTSIDLNGDVTITGAVTLSGGIGAFSLADDTAITFGTGSDATIDYDSGTTALNIDLTGVANTDLDVTTSGGANTFFIDGQNARVGIGTNAPVSQLTLLGGAPIVSMIDTGGGVYWQFGGLGSVFRINEIDGNGAIKTTNGLGTVMSIFSNSGGAGSVMSFNTANNKDLNFQFGGTTNDNMFFMDAGTQRVGINTITPQAPLGLPDDTAIGLGTSGDALIDYDSGNNSLDIDLATNGVNTDLKIVTDGNDNTLFIDGQNGNIGIGTSAPTSILHIKAQTNPKVLLEDVDNAQDWSFGSSGSNFHFIDQTAGSISRIKIVPAGEAIVNESGSDYDFRVEGVGQANALFVQGSDGFVGIGTNTPSYSLEVNGTLQADDYYSGDGTQGVTDNTSWWMCTAADCSTKCQVTVKDGLITGCT